MAGEEDGHRAQTEEEQGHPEAHLVHHLANQHPALHFLFGESEMGEERLEETSDTSLLNSGRTVGGTLTDPMSFCCLLLSAMKLQASTHCLISGAALAKLLYRLAVLLTSIGSSGGGGR